MARKFSQELKDRAVRLAFVHQQIHESSRWAAPQAIAVKLGVSPPFGVGLDEERRGFG